MNRADWLRACALARRGGKISTTLPNLVAAYRIAELRTMQSYLALMERESEKAGWL